MKRGISLVALVITIIVLIILASAVITNLQNRNILDKAKTTVDNYSTDQKEESLMLALNHIKLEASTNKEDFDEYIKDYFTDNNKKQKIDEIIEDIELIKKQNDLYYFEVNDKMFSVDLKGNIVGEVEDTKNPYVERIEFLAGHSLADYGYSEYFTDSYDHGQSLQAFANYNGFPLVSPWSGGYSIMQTINTYDFSKIDKLVVGYAMGTNSTSCINTFTFGLYDQAISNSKGFTDGIYEQIIITNSYGWLYDGEPVEELTLDTTNISGEYYIKMLNDHGPTPGSMSTGTRIYWIEIYYNDYD